MKKTLLCALLSTLFFTCSNDEATTTTADSEILNTAIPEDVKLKTALEFDNKLNETLESDPIFAATHAENEAYLAAYAKEEEEKAKSGKRNLPLFTIKVVVNNIYRTNPISMELIEGQIDRLNEAFSGTLTGRPSGLLRNAERFNAGDTRIRFVLDGVNFRRN